MIPWPNEITAAVTSSQPPQPMVAARVRSVRGPRRDAHSSTATIARAAGSSQAICPPYEDSSRRDHPVWPHIPDGPAACPPPGTTLPVSLPVSRPNPL